MWAGRWWWWWCWLQRIWWWWWWWLQRPWWWWWWRWWWWWWWRIEMAMVMTMTRMVVVVTTYYHHPHFFLHSSLAGSQMSTEFTDQALLIHCSYKTFPTIWHVLNHHHHHHTTAESYPVCLIPKLKNVYHLLLKCAFTYKLSMVQVLKITDLWMVTYTNLVSLVAWRHHATCEKWHLLQI